MDHKLSAHFKESDFACQCCSVVSVDARLLAGLEELRQRLGRPFVIHSAFRCNAHNAELGGAYNSTHLIGIAADIVVPGVPLGEVLKAAVEISNFRGFGLGDTFIHLDVRSRMEFWYYDRNKAIVTTRSRLLELAESRGLIDTGTQGSTRSEAWGTPRGERQG